MSDAKEVFSDEQMDFSTEGFILIVKNKTGEMWTNQAGGHACHHPETRGTLVEIVMPKDISEDIDKLVCDEWGCWMTYVDKITAEKFNKILYPFGMKCDQEFLQEDYKYQRQDASQEAWLNVIDPQHGPSVLAWGNSD